VWLASIIKIGLLLRRSRYAKNEIAYLFIDKENKSMTLFAVVNLLQTRAC
jgi:hypothetical protein